MKVGFSNSFFQQLQELVRQRKELEGKRFLGIFDQDNLRVLEELLKTDLATRKRNAVIYKAYHTSFAIEKTKVFTYTNFPKTLSKTIPSAVFVKIWSR
jgi:hypothetical protein